MQNWRNRVVSGVLAGLALGAGAQSMKPGLWEMRSQMKDDSGQMAAAMAQMQEQMAKLSPEERKMMESVMAGQGMQIKPAGAGVTIRMCLTQDLIDRDEIIQQEGDCKQTRLSRSGNSTRFSMVCTNPPSSAEGVITHQSAQSYTASVTVKTVEKGKPQTMQMDSSAKFIASNCGNIKPLSTQ